MDKNIIFLCDSHNIYKYESFRLTERTIVYRVIRIVDNKLIAQFGLELAAKNFTDYLNYNRINNLTEWERVPQLVKVNFISASNQCFPNL